MAITQNEFRDSPITVPATSALVKVQISQSDCYISNISLRSKTPLMILRSSTPDSDNPRVKNVVISVNNDALRLNNFLSDIHDSSSTQVKSNVKLVSSNRREKILEFTIKDSEMGLMYKKRPSKCIRLYPTSVIDGMETWNMLCEDENEAGKFLNEVSEMRNTRIIDSRISVNSTNLNSVLESTLLGNFEALITGLTPRKLEILKLVFHEKYYSPDSKIKLKEIGEILQVSKSYLSKILKEKEKIVMENFLEYMIRKGGS